MPDLMLSPTVVTVTYGDRAHLLQRTLQACVSTGVKRAVVVQNGPITPTSHAPPGIDVHYIALPRNCGSAAGYRAGLEEAVSKFPQDWIWLLDDDNAPDPTALRVLSATLERLASGTAPPTLLCYRADRPYQRRLIEGMGVRASYPFQGGFAGFNVLSGLRPVLIKLASLRGRTGRTEPLEIPYGPYSGLLVSPLTLKSVGLPDAELVLYEDDAEFTSRIARNSGPLLLVPQSRVVDLDESWYPRAAGRTPWTRLLMAESDVRVYYTLRNRMVFEQRQEPGSRVLRRINRFALLLGLRIAGLLIRRPQRMRVIRLALMHGKCERLGEILPLGDV